MLLKIAHLADLHFKLYKEHDEYREILGELYRNLSRFRPDIIAVPGDIVDKKAALSPELLVLLHEFVSRLKGVGGRVVFSLGNHEYLQNNSSRLDPISPIIDIIDSENVVLLRTSGVYDSIFPGVSFNNFSLIDDVDKWPIFPEDNGLIQIGLFHGAVEGCLPEHAFLKTMGAIPQETFTNQDLVLLGHIHTPNLVLDTEGRIRYPGSLISQNFGETGDHGYLEWTIRSFDDFSCNFVPLENKQPYVTIQYDGGRLPTAPSGSKIRILSERRLPFSEYKAVLDQAQAKYSPSLLIFPNSAPLSDSDSVSLVSSSSTSPLKENLRDLHVQERLLKSYLTRFDLDDDILDGVIALNKEITAQIPETDGEVERGSNWSLQSLSWSNLFNYGEKNYIDFSKLHGIVGLLGANYSGKSSVIESLIYALFNTTSKGSLRASEIINQHCDKGQAEVVLKIGSELIKIRRSSERKSNSYDDARTELHFERAGISQNGENRVETDKRIRKMLGALDDFLLTSYSAQLDFLAFVDAGPSKRREILARFLDLDVLERKNEVAKNRLNLVKGGLKRLGDDGGKALSDGAEVEGELKQIGGEIEAKRAEINNLSRIVEEGTKGILELEGRLQVGVNHIDKKGLLVLLGVKQKAKVETSGKLGRNRTSLEEYENKLVKILEELERIGETEEANKTIQRYSEIDRQIREITTEITNIEDKITESQRKTKCLGEVPCTTEFHGKCKFVKDAHEASCWLPEAVKRINVKKAGLTKLKQEKAALDTERARAELEKRAKLIDLRDRAIRSISEFKAYIGKQEAEVRLLGREIEDIERQVEEYDRNVELYENRGKIEEQLRGLRVAQKAREEGRRKAEEELSGLFWKQGSLTQKLETIRENIAKVRSLVREQTVLEYFCKATNVNGIAFELMSSKIPLINEELAKILATFVKFEVFIEVEDKNLVVKIKHPKHPARKVETGSGAEKSIAAMALRVALISVSSLPCQDCLLLDEPAVSLDSDNLEGFGNLLLMLKSFFRCIIIVSHLDVLKDMVDVEIPIEKKDGFAHVDFN